MSPHNKNPQKNDYNAQLDVILSTPLTPNNVDHYAESALNEVADLVQTYREDYRHQPTIAGETGREEESRASSYYGLSNVNVVLDHLQAKQEEINDIAKVIGKSINLNHIILPPDAPKREIIAGRGSFEQPSTIQRLKTTLFILKNEFEVDIHNPEELKISIGKITSGMMRGQSYCSLEIPKLNRQVLVCDEEGNASFIFDTKKLRLHDITPDFIMNSTKADLKRLALKYPSAGIWVKYNEGKFADHIAQAIKNPTTELYQRRSQVAEEQRATYLYPTPPEGVLPSTRIAKTFGVSKGTLKKILTSLDIEPTGTYRMSNQIVDGYDEHKQQQIQAELEKRGFFSENAPENILNPRGMAKLYGCDDGVIYRVIESLDIEPTGKFRFRHRIVDGYDEHKQQQIQAELEKRGIFARKAPEGTLHIAALASEFGVGTSTIQSVIEDLGIQSKGKYKFGSKKATDGYDEHDQQQIQAELEKRGLPAEQPPEGILSLADIGKRFDLTFITIQRVVDDLGLEPSGMYKFGRKAGRGYDQKTQDQIHIALTKRGILAERAPDGYLSLQGIGDQLGFDAYTTIKRIIKDLGIKPSGKYKFGPTVAEGYNQATQNMIVEELKRRGRL